MNRSQLVKFLKTRLLRETLLVLVFRFLAAFGALTSSIVLARYLGATDFGRYSLILSLTTFLALPVRMGLPTLVIRETSRADAHHNWARMRGIWRWMIMASSVAAVAIVLTVALFTAICGNLVRKESIENLLFATILLYPLAINSNLAAALRGLRRVFSGVFPDEVVRPFLMAALVFTAAASTSNALDASTAIALYLLTTMFTLLLLWWLFRKNIPPQCRQTTEREYNTREWISVLVPLTFMSGLHVVNQNADILMIGFFRTNAEVANYKVAVSGAAFVIFGLNALQAVVMPTISRLHAQGNTSKLQTLCSAAAMGSVALSLPFLLVFFLWGDELIITFYGSEFSGAWQALAILSTSQTVNAFFGVLWSVLTMTGYQRDGVRALIVATLTNLALNAILIPLYGTNGAALATAVSIVVCNVLYWLTAYVRLGIDCTPITLIISWFRRC